jgi:hypothetical protein
MADNLLLSSLVFLALSMAVSTLTLIGIKITMRGVLISLLVFFGAFWGGQLIGLLLRGFEFVWHQYPLVTKYVLALFIFSVAFWWALYNAPNQRVKSDAASASSEKSE